jgi:chitodextrinase
VGGSSLTYSDTTVTATTSYSYTVDAYDAAGNHSAQSAAAAVTTPAADSQAPTVPNGLTATAASSTRVNLSWSASTDNVGVTGYTIYRGGAQLAMVGGSTVGYSDTTAAASTSYSYTVDAYDAAGNHSTQSAAATVTTPSASGGNVDFVQAGSGSTETKVASTTIVMSKPVGAGDLLVGWFGQYDSTGQVSISDNVNGAWTRAAAETFNNGGGDIALYYVTASRPSVSGLAITISASNPTYLQGSAAEYSGPAGSVPDQVAVGRGASSSASAGPTPATPAGELVFGAINSGGSPGSLTPGSSQGQAYSVRSATGSGSSASEDILSSTAGTQTSGFALGAATDWYMVVATFRFG